VKGFDPLFFFPPMRKGFKHVDVDWLGIETTRYKFRKHSTSI